MGGSANRGHYAPRVPNLQAGSYVLGPANGTLSVHTKRTGAAAKAGHNLLFHVTSWEARLAAGPDGVSSLELDVDATSLRVIEGTGGMQALGDDDKANIQQTDRRRGPEAPGHHVPVDRVQPAADGRGFGVQGDLTLLGTVRPLAFEVTVG